VFCLFVWKAKSDEILLLNFFNVFKVEHNIFCLVSSSLKGSSYSARGDIVEFMVELRKVAAACSGAGKGKKTNIFFVDELGR
jgi:hypothetical protein